MNRRPAYGLLCALLALTLAALACGGGPAAATVVPTLAPTLTAPTKAPTAVPTAAPPTVAPTQAATQPPATSAPTATEAAQATNTEAATAGPSNTQAAQATATKGALSGKIDISGVTSYLDSSKFFHIVGLITNGTDKPIDNIQLTVQLTDSSGKSVLLDDSGNATDKVTINPMLAALASGESAPLEYYFDTNKADTTGWTPKVTVTSSETPGELKRVDVVVENNLMSTNSDGEVFLSGELVNKSDQPAQVDDFAGAMILDNGDVAAASVSGAVSRILAPTGDSGGLDRTPFAIRVDGPVKTGAKPQYFISATEATPDALSTATDLHLKLNAGYVDSDSFIHVIATISNSGTNTVTTQAVAGLYDKSGKVLDATQGNTPFDLAPGSSSQVFLSYYPSVDGSSDQIAKVVSYTAQIDPYWTFSVSHSVVTLKATGVTTDVAGSTVTVKGIIANTAKQTVNATTVVVLAKNADGKIVAGAWTAADESGDVKPGAKTTFSLDLGLPGSADAASLTYDVQVQAQVSQ